MQKYDGNCRSQQLIYTKHKNAIKSQDHFSRSIRNTDTTLLQSFNNTSKLVFTAEFAP